ncbi:tetratricopeptide repeat protein [Myxococcota bacterium]|nr:tetratricopeptide repeat protein [Myxococcota bacterium]
MKTRGSKSRGSSAPRSLRWPFSAGLVSALMAPAFVVWAQTTPATTDAPPTTSGGNLRALAQQAQETATSTVTEDSEAPAEGPGSKISSEEAQPAKPSTAAEVEAAAQSRDADLAQLAKELEYYRQGQVSFAADVRDLIRTRYNAQKEQLASQYDKGVEELETEERSRRMEAIARFEEFLRKYPADPVYTPDAMFRLAELYFEKAQDEYNVASKAHEQQLAAFERGERPDEPLAPEPHYEKTVGLYLDLLARFPDYRLADAARYLLGYCYSEQGQIDEALVAYQGLVDKHPDSKFLPEVWTRIGEIYFDKNEKGSLEQAIAAYQKVLQYKDSPYYDKALYKVAWTYYRLDRFPEAVAAFIDLVQYADEQRRLTGRTGSELRAEAIQYIAISLADDDWGGLDRAKEVLDPYDKKPFVGELWKRFGEILFDQTRYPLAIQVLDFAIQKYPDAPYNPEMQAKIVTAYEQLRDFDGATAAREKLVKNYSEQSRWHEVNKDDKAAIAQAKSLTEKSLYTAAIFRHQQAQAYKQANRLEDARRSYQAAATAYQTYLAQFPEAKNAYDFEFFLAECLYYSDDFTRAAAQYDKVRDSTLDNKHLEAAALSAVITYEKQVEQEIKAKAIPELKPKTAAERKGKAPAPQPLAPIRQKLVDASDRYVKLLPSTERTPAIAYRAGEVFYAHDQLDEARARFERVVAMAPKSEVARFASNWIIESYLAAEDWRNVKLAAQRLLDLQATAKSDKPPTAEEQKKQGDFVDQLKVFRVGAEFKIAEKLDAEGKYEEAANEYVALVNETPKHEFADKALYNAAVAYEKVKRFETASQVYQRIYDEYPKSDLAPRALFRVGVNNEKEYDFPAAIAAYTRLVERYPESEFRADALYNVAVTLENMQQYGQAAQAFKRYATTFEKREDAGENFYRAALVYEKMGAWPDMIETLRAFTAKYKNAPAQKERIVEAYMKIGDAYKAQKNEKEQVASYGTCVREFSNRRLPMESRASAYAAKCAFELAEAEFRRYDAVKLTGTGKAQIRALELKAKEQRNVEKVYTDVFKYKRVEQTLAASYRIGFSYERFAEALFAAEVPPEFQNNEELANEYKAQLEEKAGVLERKAEAAYRKAFEEAKKTRVTNEWTERTLEGLNKYQPKEFPVQRSGKPAIQTFNISGNGLDTLGVGGAAPATGGLDAATDGSRSAEAKP